MPIGGPPQGPKGPKDKKEDMDDCKMLILYCLSLLQYLKHERNLRHPHAREIALAISELSNQLLDGTLPVSQAREDVGKTITSLENFAKNNGVPAADISPERISQYADMEVIKAFNPSIGDKDKTEN